MNKYKFNNPETIKEITILFPELKNISIGRHISNVNTDSSKTEIVLLYQTDDKIKKFDTEKLQQWLSQKLKTTDIKIVRQQ